jgi:hypothetical protein
MAKPKTRPVADSTNPEVEKSKEPKKIKTAVCLKPSSMRCVDAACSIEQMTQSELFEFLIKTHLSGYYVAVPENRRITKIATQASPAIPAETTDRPDPAESVSQTAASPL